MEGYSQYTVSPQHSQQGGCARIDARPLFDLHDRQLRQLSRNLIECGAGADLLPFIVGGWVSPVLFPPLGVSPGGCVGAGPPSGSLSRVALAFMGSHAAPSGGSASDDWTTQGRTRGKARGSTRAGAPVDSALRHL